MIKPGEDGYDFPCGDSHSRIDHFIEGNFYNEASGRMIYPTNDEIEKFYVKQKNDIECLEKFLAEKHPEIFVKVLTNKK